MFISKKISKFRRKPALLEKNNSIRDDEKIKSRRCRFKEIPPPSKFSFSKKCFLIYGDICFVDYNGNLVTDLSTLNEFKSVQDITVNDMFDQKIVTIKLAHRLDKELASWTDFITYLNESEKFEMREWAEKIKNFSHTYSKVMQRQSRKKMKSGPRKKFFAQVTFQTEQQKRILFNTYPCLQLKFRLKNHHNQLKEILISENLVKEMGHSIESFAISVLQEGLPQLLPYENPLAEFVMKSLVQNYFTIGENGCEFPEIDSKLIIKNKFAKNISLKTYVFMNYEMNTFGMDLIFAISAIGEPYLVCNNNLEDLINPDFVETMKDKEKESDEFLSSFYNQHIQRIYSNLGQICSIKELSQECTEKIIVKKYEDF